MYFLSPFMTDRLHCNFAVIPLFCLWFVGCGLISRLTVHAVISLDSTYIYRVSCKFSRYALMLCDFRFFLLQTPYKYIAYLESQLWLGIVFLLFCCFSNNLFAAKILISVCYVHLLHVLLTFIYDCGIWRVDCIVLPVIHLLFIYSFCVWSIGCGLISRPAVHTTCDSLQFLSCIEYAYRILGWIYYSIRMWCYVLDNIRYLYVHNMRDAFFLFIIFFYNFLFHP